MPSWSSRPADDRIGPKTRAMLDCRIRFRGIPDWVDHFGGETMAKPARKKAPRKKVPAKSGEYQEPQYPLVPDKLMPEKGDYLLKLGKDEFFLLRRKSVDSGKPELQAVPADMAKAILYRKRLHEVRMTEDPPTMVIMSCR
jgi:hypothetical protein